jgi:hypothetical protein
MFHIAFGVSRRTSTYIQKGLRVLEIQEQSGNTYASARRTQLNNLISSFDFIDGVRLDGSSESLADTNVPLQGNPNHHSILQRFVERTGSTGDYAEVSPFSSSAAGNRRIPQLYGQAWPETPEAAAAAHAQMQQQQQEQHAYNMPFGSSSHHNNNDTNNNDSHHHSHNHNTNNNNGNSGLPVPATGDSFYGLNNIDRELWNEISFQPPLWLGNVSDEFKNLITEL